MNPDTTVSEGKEIEGKVVYFPKIRQVNTDRVLAIASRRAKELGVKTVLVASTTGDVAVRATEVFKGLKLVVISHAWGIKGANTQEFTPEARKKVEAAGATIVTMSHAFRGGVSGALVKKYNMRTETDIMAQTLRIFGHGMKVAVENALMAADAGLVRTDELVVSIGGMNRGADTAIVVKPVNTIDFFDMKVNEILCKPYF